MTQSNHTDASRREKSGTDETDCGVWVSIMHWIRGESRGQAHTIEAVIGSVLIISVVIFAVQATGLSPLITATTDEQIETQHQKLSTGVLDHTTTVSASGAASGREITAAKHMTLYWNQSQQAFHNASPGGYQGVYPQTTFGTALETAFETESLTANVYVSAETGGGGVSTHPVIVTGEPTDTAVTTTETVVLYDDDGLTGPGSVSPSVEDVDGFYASDAHPSNRVYNVIEIRVEVWRV